MTFLRRGPCVCKRSCMMVVDSLCGDGDGDGDGDGTA